MNPKDDHVEAAPRSTDAVVDATKSSLILQVSQMLAHEAYHYCADCHSHCRQLTLTVEAFKESLREESSLSERNAALVAALQDLYDYQQSISSPDTRWGLPVYQRARAALSLARGEQKKEKNDAS